VRGELRRERRRESRRLPPNNGIAQHTLHPLNVFIAHSLVFSVDFDLATVFGLLSQAFFEVPGIEFLLEVAPGWSVLRRAGPRYFGYINPAAALRAILDRACFRGREGKACAAAFALKACLTSDIR
jgi:hypothetical protein